MSETDEEDPFLDCEPPYLPTAGYLLFADGPLKEEARRHYVIECLRLDGGSLDREWMKEAPALEEWLRSGIRPKPAK